MNDVELTRSVSCHLLSSLGNSVNDKIVKYEWPTSPKIDSYQNIKLISKKIITGIALIGILGIALLETIAYLFLTIISSPILFISISILDKPIELLKSSSFTIILSLKNIVIYNIFEKQIKGLDEYVSEEKEIDAFSAKLKDTGIRYSSANDDFYYPDNSIKAARAKLEEICTNDQEEDITITVKILKSVLEKFPKHQKKSYFNIMLSAINESTLEENIRYYHIFKSTSHLLKLPDELTSFKESSALMVRIEESADPETDTFNDLSSEKRHILTILFDICKHEVTGRSLTRLCWKVMFEE